jgi:hypothetical protein
LRGDGAQVAVVEDHVRRHLLRAGPLQTPLTQSLEQGLIHLKWLLVRRWVVWLWFWLCFATDPLTQAGGVLERCPAGCREIEDDPAVTELPRVQELFVLQAAEDARDRHLGAECKRTKGSIRAGLWTQIP